MSASLPPVPDTMKAMVVNASGQMPTLQTVPTPKDLKPDDVLVRMDYSGVCHTDLHAMKGDWPLATIMPLIGGHEGAGQVVRVGSAVNNVKVGDWVGVKWINSSCMNCAFCAQTDEPLCQHATMSGYTVHGTFAEYTVGQAMTVARIPDACVPLKPELAPILCAGITVYKGLKESGIKAGQSVAIVGAGGGLGCLAVQYAKAMGFRPIAIDTGDEKRRVTAELGAEAFVDFMNPGPDGMTAAVRKAAGGDGLGPNAVLLVAVNEKPFQQAAEYVRPRGTVVCIGLPAGAQFKAPIFDTVIRMINIKGSYVGNRQDSAEALDFFARGLIHVPVKVVPLSELPAVYEKMEKGEIAGRYVLDIAH